MEESLARGKKRRDPLRLALAERRIQTSLHYPPIRRFSAFAGEAAETLAVSQAFAARMITLPIYAGLSEEGVEEIAEAMEELSSSEEGARCVA